MPDALDRILQRNASAIEMAVNGMADTDQLRWGDLVKYNGTIYACCDCKTRRSTGDISIASGDALLWVKACSVELCRPVCAGADVVRSFFRLKESPRALAARGLFPFAAGSEAAAIDSADIAAALLKLEDADDMDLYAWYGCFADRDCFLRLRDADEMTRVYFCILKKIHANEFDEDVCYGYGQLRGTILKNMHTPIGNMSIPEYLRSMLIDVCEDMAANEGISDELHALCIKILNTPTEYSELWRCEYLGYGYYGGNALLPCDWKKSEESLLEFYKLDSETRKFTANSLGYIYASKRLGAPDYEKAFRYFEEAANAGVIEAQYKLSDLYRLGHGVAQDGEKAMALLRSVYNYETMHANDGDVGHLPDAALRMGYCCRDGIGCTPSNEKAYTYFRQAEAALAQRMREGGSFGDETVLRNVRFALSELLKVYNPSGD